MAAIEGAMPVLSTPLDALAGAYPSAPSTLDVVVSAGAIDGQEIDESTVSFDASTATEFARDLVSVDPADGTLTKTAGTETTDQTAGSAAKPTLPAGEVELFTALVTDTLVSAIEQAARGAGLETDPVLTVTFGGGMIDGVAIAAGSVTFTASTSTDFAKDLVSVDPSDGSITVTAGTEADTAILAVVPGVPAGDIGLFAATVGDATVGVTALDYTVRGQDPAASS